MPGIAGDDNCDSHRTSWITAPFPHSRAPTHLTSVLVRREAPLRSLSGSALSRAIAPHQARFRRTPAGALSGGAAIRAPLSLPRSFASRVQWRHKTCSPFSAAPTAAISTVQLIVLASQSHDALGHSIDQAEFYAAGRIPSPLPSRYWLDSPNVGRTCERSQKRSLPEIPSAVAVLQ
jgi:hypothetical protein